MAKRRLRLVSDSKPLVPMPLPIEVKVRIAEAVVYSIIYAGNFLLDTIADRVARKINERTKNG